MAAARGWCGARVHQRPLSADGSGVVAQIMREIDERKTFLDSMRQMGQGAMYEAQISAEISQRIALLERIDRQRVDVMRSQSIASSSRELLRCCPRLAAH